MLDISLSGVSQTLSNLVGDVDISYTPFQDMVNTLASHHLAVGDHNDDNDDNDDDDDDDDDNENDNSGYTAYYYSSTGYYYDEDNETSYNSEYYGVSYSYDTAYDEVSSYYFYYDPDTNYYYDSKTEEEIWLIVLYVVLGILGVLLLIFVGALIFAVVFFIWSASSFVGLLIFPPLFICLLTTGGRLTECSLGYIEADGTSWPYDYIFKPLFQLYESQSHKFTNFSF